MFNILSHSFHSKFKLMENIRIHLWLRRTCSSDTTAAENLFISEKEYSLKRSNKIIPERRPQQWLELNVLHTSSRRRLGYINRSVSRGVIAKVHDIPG